MAIDTADKRASIMGQCLPWLTVFPGPDGTIDDLDRIQAGDVYRLEAAEPPEPPPPVLLADNNKRSGHFILWG
jgi:hypothetical protein